MNLAVCRIIAQSTSHLIKRNDYIPLSHDGIVIKSGGCSHVRGVDRSRQDAAKDNLRQRSDAVKFKYPALINASFSDSVC